MNLHPKISIVFITSINRKVIIKYFKTVAKSKKEFTLEIGNSLVFEKVKELRKKFDKSIGNTLQIRIISEKINEIDLTGIQLLYYFLLKARTFNREVLFTLNIADEQRQMLLKNGFTNLTETLFK